MPTYIRGIFRTAIIASVFALVSPAVRAEVTKVEISSRQDVAGGKAFGSVGAYEKLRGKVYFSVDPQNPHNKNIVDIDKAPKNKDGKVEFSSDLLILKPKNAARANGVLFFDIINRGQLQLLGVFNRAGRSQDPMAEADFGDGLLMRGGYTLVAVGWQFDVAKGKNNIGFDAPVATENGQPITGPINPWFIPDKASDSFEYVTQYNTSAYPPLDPANAEYRMTEREGWIAAPRLIPREDWQFGRLQNGKVTADPNWVTLKGGFKAGMTYSITYQTKNPPVVALGSAAIRDLASALKYKSDSVVRGKYVYTYGQSQTGRSQRQLVYDGFTIDEQGRKAIDAMFIQTGATSLGSFNERFAQPNEIGSFTQTKFPIRYEITTDPATGKRDGLGARVPAGLEPKLFLVDSGSEYWDRGRVAALRHVSLDGTQDLPDPPNVRTYLVAGTQHGSGSWPPSDGGGQLQVNPQDYRWADQSLLVAMDKWVREGVEPPAAKHPLLSDGTLVAQTKIKFPNMSGVQWPYHVPGGYRADVTGPYSALPFLVPQVDADGNDVGGIRLPEQAVPLGTYTDWSFRSEKLGAPETLIAMQGSFIPFAKTKAEREKNHDPRPSIEERYPTRAEYLKQVEAAANKLAGDHYLLAEHVKPIVEAAGQHWDWIMKTGVATN